MHTRRDPTPREANALRLHYLEAGQVGLDTLACRLPWWMYGETWRRRALERYDEYCVIVGEALKHRDPS